MCAFWLVERGCVPFMILWCARVCLFVCLFVLCVCVWLFVQACLKGERNKEKSETPVRAVEVSHLGVVDVLEKNLAGHVGGLHHGQGPRQATRQVHRAGKVGLHALPNQFHLLPVHNKELTA